jgi:hypothetical protein
MREKEIYREFSRNELSIPIFYRGGWLDASAGPDAWDVALVRKADQIAAAMPYVLRRRYGLRAIGQPALTQTLGPCFRPGDGKSGQRLSNEKDLMQALIDQLPAFDYFNQSWHYSRTNWQSIKHAAHVTQRFDFGGSMLEPVERVFRSFGATQMPYFNISKTPSRLLRARQGLLSVIKGKYRARNAVI